MKRGLLRWFFLGVQFVLLAVSIPKVAMLFHAYDSDVLGPLIGGIDIRSWCVGIVIDLTATVVTWAALQKYEATNKRLSLIAPGVIIAICSGLSVIANYEAAAAVHPERYAHVSLFEYPALLINPLLISAPPVIVLLLIIVVPAVLARPRLKTAEEIEAATAEEEALIVAKARVRKATALANADVRSARLSGWKDTVGAMVERGGPATTVLPELPEAYAAEPVERALPAPTTRMTKAMWSAMSLKERVLQSGIISPQEVAEALGISLTRARELTREVRTPEGEQRAVPGRTGVPYQTLIDALYMRRSKDSFAQAQKLESALGLRKKTRQLHAVGDAGDNPTVPLIDVEESEEVAD